MSTSELPPEFREQLNHVTGKRSRIVVEHILEHGFITTDELEQTYGYMHPPRAVRDVREQGIPIETYRIRSPDGRNIAAYRFGNPEEAREGRSGGRITFPRKFKLALFDQQDGKCAICNGLFANRELQGDHRIPTKLPAMSIIQKMTRPLTYCSADRAIEQSLGLVNTARTGKGRKK